MTTRDDELIRLREQLQATQAMLHDAATVLQGIGCQFWACDGPDTPPEDMETCHRCEFLYRYSQQSWRPPRNWDADNPEPDDCTEVWGQHRTMRSPSRISTWRRTPRGWYCTSMYPTEPEHESAYTTWTFLLGLWGPLTEIVKTSGDVKR